MSTGNHRGPIEAFPSLLTHQSIPAFSQNPSLIRGSSPPPWLSLHTPLPLHPSRSPRHTMASPPPHSTTTGRTPHKLCWNILLRLWSHPRLSPPTAPQPLLTIHPAPHHPPPALRIQAVGSPVGMTTRRVAQWKRAETSLSVILTSHYISHNPAAETRGWELCQGYSERVMLCNDIYDLK